jgi:hypothetical protein
MTKLRRAGADSPKAPSSNYLAMTLPSSVTLSMLRHAPSGLKLNKPEIREPINQRSKI